MRLRTILASASSAVIFASCSGGGGGTPRLTAPAPAPAASAFAQATSAPLATGFEYGAATLGSAALQGPAHFGALTIDVALRVRDALGLATYARAVNDPASPLYRQFLTPQQIGDRFGASPADQQTVAGYFAGAGVAVSGWPQRLMLRLTGTQNQLETAFHTKFGVFKSGTTTEIAPISAPSLPVALAVAGSPNLVRAQSPFHTNFVKSGASNGLATGFSPQQIANAFDYTGAYAAGFTGAGINVGIIGTGPISLTSPGHVGDVDYYKKTFGIGGSGDLTVISATDKNLAGNAATGFATPPPLTATSSTCNNATIAANGSGLPASDSPSATCNPEDGETQLDTETISGLAYDSHVQYYLAYNANDQCVDANGNAVIGTPCPTTGSQGANGGPGFPLQGIGEIDEELQSAIAANTSDIVSLSIGEPEPSPANYPGEPADLNLDGTGIEPVAVSALAAEGIAVFASSGDAGALNCTVSKGVTVSCGGYPSTDPNAVAVGGITAPLDGAGNFNGPLEAWGIGTAGGYAGSTGGFSRIFPLSTYQTGAAGVTGSLRNVPDVSLDADPGTGVAIVSNADPSLGGVSIAAFGGTSVSAPEMAAMWALVLNACKATASCATAKSGPAYRLGNPNAYFYQIYNGKATMPYANVFADVLYGDNAALPGCVLRQTTCPSGTPQLEPGFMAGAGYDRTTGIGVPFARNLIQAVVGV